MRIGIDFGTCNSSAALLDGDEMIPIKPNASSYSLPSNVFVAPNGKIFVGEIANKQRLSDFSAFRREIKRDLGEETPHLFGKLNVEPVNLIAAVVGEIKRDADNFASSTGRPSLRGAVLTVPATYGDYKRELMQQVAMKAGFIKEGVELLDEPLAAGLYYARQGHLLEGEILLVYDLGGGTFDTALLQKQGDSFRYYPDSLPDGLPQCGGVDFDRMIYRDFLARHPEVQDVVRRDDNTGWLAQLEIESACVDIKHELSKEDEIDMPVSVPGVPGVIHHQLTRTAFNAMIADTIHKTIDRCREMIQKANVRYDQISCLLLVGGSCRIPYVREALKKEFGRPIFAATDLELVVCQGAALYATRNERPQKKVTKIDPAASPPSPKEVKTGDVVVPKSPWDFLKKKEK